MEVNKLADTPIKDLINKGVINLLDSSGAYVVNRYPWAYEGWKRQQQIHWLGEEVPMGDDLRDWNDSARISEVERSLLMHIFRLFTQSDIEVGENYVARLLQVFQPLEVRMMLSAFNNTETIHIDAYALLLTTLGIPEGEFLAFGDYAAMRSKVEFMHGFHHGNPAEVAETIAIFGAFIEGLALFASFAMLLNFPRFNKMKGMGQIVTWSVRDESLHCECMIRLFHEWNNQTGVVNKQISEKIVEFARQAVNLEAKFIELAFEMGSLPGLTSEEMIAYIQYIADWRLTQLTLPTLYGYFSYDENYHSKQLKDHPLPWLTEILNGVEHANFFEQRATEYSKTTSLGVWDGVDGVWSKFDDEVNKV